MQTWTIKRRIVVGFSVVFLLVAGLAIATFILLSRVEHEAASLEVDSMPGTTAMAEARGVVYLAQIELLRHVLSKDPNEKQMLEGDLAKMKERITKTFEDYDRSITLAEDRGMFDELKEARTKYIAARDLVLELSRSGKTEEAMAVNVAKARPAFDAYQAIVDKMLEWNLNRANASVHHAAGYSNWARWVTGGVSLLVLALGAAVAALIVIGLNRMLTRVCTSLNEGAVQVTVASGQVSTSSQSLAEGSSEQAASIEETSSSLEEMSSMTRRNAENAQKANELAKQARSAADRGVEDMQAMSRAMETIKASSDDIAKIIKTIDEIAFQTNILALNAAVEAARAGEAGMGFAVVADEVRNLAQRSAVAAKETASKIEAAIGNTAQGVDINAKVAAALNDIVTKARQVDELAAEVANASREQTQGISQINAAVGQMDKVTQGNAASAEEGAAAAEELNAQSFAMKESVRELMQLVGGSLAESGSGAESNLLSPAPASAARKTASKMGMRAPQRAVAPKPDNVVASRRSEIPLTGDFKDF